MKQRLRVGDWWGDRERESDVYDEEEIEHLLEDDEVSPEEEAFMRGYLEES